MSTSTEDWFSNLTALTVIAPTELLDKRCASTRSSANRIGCSAASGERAIYVVPAAACTRGGVAYPARRGATTRRVSGAQTARAARGRLVASRRAPRQTLTRRAADSRAVRAA